MKRGEWVTGRGWDEGKLAERRYITAADLDTVAPDNPVWLMRPATTASRRLRAGLSGGDERDHRRRRAFIDRDAQGKVTVMKESAMALVRTWPLLTREQQRAGLVKMSRTSTRKG